MSIIIGEELIQKCMEDDRRNRFMIMCVFSHSGYLCRPIFTSFLFYIFKRIVLKIFDFPSLSGTPINFLLIILLVYVSIVVICACFSYICLIFFVKIDELCMLIFVFLGVVTVLFADYLKQVR